MVNYNDIPDWWALCPNKECEMAATCLRHQICKQVPERFTQWNCVLPNALQNGKCSYYQKYEKVLMAKGIGSIYKNVKSKEARSRIRVELTHYLGSKGTYYRYKDGMRWINPDLQQIIRDIVHKYAPDVKVEFDKTVEGYDFTRIHSKMIF